MKKNYLYMVALAMLAAACNNENDSIQNGNKPAPEVNMITETITASNGDNSPATRANVDADANFTWSIGDQIAVHVSDSKYYTTDELTVGGSNEASFTVSYLEGEVRNAFAVFPASIVAAAAENYGQTGEALDVTLPGSYTLAEVGGTSTPCPMIAANTPGETLDFKQICGLLRLTVNCLPPSTSYLTIDFNGNKVQGTFSIASPVTPGTSYIETSTTEGTDDIITITDLGISGWTDGIVLNLPLPTGTYTNVTITVYNSSDEAVITFTRPFKVGEPYNASRAKGRKVNASAPVFSISGSTRVIFAPGNLQATTEDQGANWNWSFAANQYDYIGSNGINTKVTSSPGVTSANGTVDLFYRSLEGNGYGITSSTETSGVTFVDWSDLTIGSYQVGYWQTLTESQWKYVVGKDSYIRTPHTTVNDVANARGTKAVVNGVKGFLLFPDFYDGPTANVGEDIVWGAGINTMSTSGWNTTCTLDGWKILEEADCVFLPAAGRRSSTTLYEVGTAGYYDSSTYWKMFRINNSGFDPNQSSGYAGSVRLVHVIN